MAVPQSEPDLDMMSLSGANRSSAFQEKRPPSSRLSTLTMSGRTSQAPTSAAVESPTTPAAQPTNNQAAASSAAAVPSSSSSPSPSSAAEPPANSSPQSQPPPVASSSTPAAAAPSSPSSPPSPTEERPPPVAATSSSSPPQHAVPPPSSSSTTPSQPSPPPAAAAPSSSSSQQQQPEASSAIVTVTPSNLATSVQVVTSTTTRAPAAGPLTTSSHPPLSTSSSAAALDPSATSTGLNQASRVAIGVVVPIAAIAFLAIVGLFWWKKRRARQEAEEERRKEVEDYSYNPNADPTMPTVEHAYEMKDDGGYRGWGSTATATTGSRGRKASTTMSGGAAGTYSDPASPTRANLSEARSGEPLVDGSSSHEGEILGAMGPSAAHNRGGGADVRRGPSNASSSYSAAARSDGSDGAMYGNNGAAYYEQYGQNPYGEQRPHEPGSQAVIRDNPARRNTRIENSAHYPQQSAGIAQNF